MLITKILKVNVKYHQIIVNDAYFEAVEKAQLFTEQDI